MARLWHVFQGLPVSIWVMTFHPVAPNPVFVVSSIRGRFDGFSADPALFIGCVDGLASR